MKKLYEYITSDQLSGKKSIAVLLDTDEFHSEDDLLDLLNTINKSKVGYVFVGGSLLSRTNFESTCKLIHRVSEKPVILFPGNEIQVTENADGILLLSLISGRNADLLIGKHVQAAPYIKDAAIEILPTGYMLIDSGVPTSASYMSNTMPIPANKAEIAACTALAGEQLGLKLFYLDGGSGAKDCVPEKMIKTVRKTIQSPIIVGGGIRSTEAIRKAWDAGADIVVIGTAIENQHITLREIDELEELKL